MDTFSGECFRPLSGNLLSLQTIEKAMTVFPRKFSSPIGESTFSTTLQRQPSTSQSSGFRPLSGNLLSLQLFAKVKKHILKVFVPYRGIYFLYKYKIKLYIGGHLFSSPIGESTFSTLPLEPLCLSGFRSCFAGQNLKIVFLFLFLMLAPLFPLFYAVRRKILFTAGKTLFFPFPYHIIFLDISCICIHAVQLQGLRPLHVYAVHTL